MPKLIGSTCRKNWCLSACKNQLHPSLLSWDIAKILQTCYFGYFWDNWLSTEKMILSVYWKHWWLSSCKESYVSLTSCLKHYKDITNLLFLVPSAYLFFKKYYILKNPAIWLVKNILVDNFKTCILPDMQFVMESQEIKELSSCFVFRKTKWQNFFKNAK